jgi:hypothetical protein
MESFEVFRENLYDFALEILGPTIGRWVLGK